MSTECISYVFEPVFALPVNLTPSLYLEKQPNKPATHLLYPKKLNNKLFQLSETEI